MSDGSAENSTKDTSKTNPQAVTLADKIELYKFYAQTATATTENRIKYTKFFITINTALLAAMGVSLKTYANYGFFIVILCLIIGIALNCLWVCIIKSFRRLNRFKFKVIKKLEQSLPEGFNCVSQEGEIDKTEGRISHTRLERYTAKTLIIVYTITLVLIGGYAAGLRLTLSYQNDGIRQPPIQTQQHPPF